MIAWLCTMGAKKVIALSVDNAYEKVKDEILTYYEGMTDAVGNPVMGKRIEELLEWNLNRKNWQRPMNFTTTDSRFKIEPLEVIS